MHQTHAVRDLTLNLLTTTIVAPPSNARKLQKGFNSAFKGLKHKFNPQQYSMQLVSNLLFFQKETSVSPQ